MDQTSAILAKPLQRDREAAALRIFSTPGLQAELERVRARFAASPLAAREDARRTIDPATGALAFQAALYAANFDTVEPFALWGTNAAHSWMGLDVLPSGYGLDAPDNVYRHATLDGAGRYRVRGVVHGSGPAQQTFVVYRTIPGATHTMNAEGHMEEIAGIKSESIVRDADGGFTITVDADPPGDRANHLQVPADHDGLHMVVRDSLADWTTELPVELTVERLDAVDPQPRDEEAMAEHTVAILAAYAPFWLNWYETYAHAKPLNEVVPPWKRVQGWGLTQQGCFAFDDDEAWVLTLHPLGAGFFDFQISDPWTRAVEYIDRTASFNANQAVADADGTITLVAAPNDPGVHNWLDTSGMTSGTFQVRWQSLPEGVSGEGAVREVKVVKVAELADHLPAGTAYVTPEERAEQQRERAASYANRLR